MHHTASRVLDRVAVAAAVLFVSACAAKGDAPSPGPAQDAFGELRAKVVEVVDDPQREAEALQEIDALFRELRLLENSVVDRRNRFRELNADYDTPREEFESFLVEVQAEMRERRSSAAAHHRRLVATLTPAELGEVMKLNSKALGGALRELQSM